MIHCSSSQRNFTTINNAKGKGKGKSPGNGYTRLRTIAEGREPSEGVDDHPLNRERREEDGDHEDDVESDFGKGRKGSHRQASSKKTLLDDEKEQEQEERQIDVDSEDEIRPVVSKKMKSKKMTEAMSDVVVSQEEEPAIDEQSFNVCNSSSVIQRLKQLLLG